MMVSTLSLRKAVLEWGAQSRHCCVTVADFYIVLLNAVLADPNAVPHGREGFYILENGEHSWYELGRALGKALVELGVSKSAEPTPFTDHEIDKYIGNSVRLASRQCIPRHHALTRELFIDGRPSRSRFERTRSG